MKKKLVFILGIITLLIIIFITKGEYPNRLPKMSIEYSGQSYKAGIDEFTWFDNYGNSNLGEGEMKAAKKIQAIDMNPESKFTFKLSYEKNISDIRVVEVIQDGYDGGKRILEPIEISYSKVKVSNEKGEHVYSIYVFWDSTSKSCHCINYIVKVNVI